MLITVDRASGRLVRRPDALKKIDSNITQYLQKTRRNRVFREHTLGLGMSHFDMYLSDRRASFLANIESYRKFFEAPWQPEDSHSSILFSSLDHSIQLMEIGPSIVLLHDVGKDELVRKALDFINLIHGKLHEWAIHTTKESLVALINDWFALVMERTRGPGGIFKPDPPPPKALTRSYHGERLFEVEWRAMRDLERANRLRIPVAPFSGKRLGKGQAPKFGIDIEVGHVTALHLSHHNLALIPESIQDLQKLEFMSLFSNRLVELPAAIGNLGSLRMLNINRNQITSLPDTIGNLGALEVLDVNQNRLSSLPTTIGNLGSLRILEISQNQLTSLPATIGNLATLECLEVVENLIQSLPESIGGLLSLSRLVLINNPLKSLLSNIGKLHSLEHLYLAGTQLTDLPEEVWHLPNLEALLIANNPGISLTGHIARGVETLRRRGVSVQ